MRFLPAPRRYRQMPLSIIQLPIHPLRRRAAVAPAPFCAYHSGVPALSRAPSAIRPIKDTPPPLMSSSETTAPNEHPGGDGPRDEWLEANGVTLHCRDWGGDGPPVLLLHGLASTCRIWDLTAPLLARRFAVLAIDQRGHGQSGKPDSGYDFATVGQDAAAVLQAKGIQRPLLVGHSWGADVALELAAAQPGLARGLCFIDGGMIEPAARYATLEEARRQMAPPDFSGVTAAQLLEQAGRPRTLGHAGRPGWGVPAGELPGGAGRHAVGASVPRQSSADYRCAVGTPPAPIVSGGKLPGAAAARPMARRPGVGRAPGGPGRCRRPRRGTAAPQRRRLAGRQRPRCAAATPRTGSRNHHPPLG